MSTALAERSQHLKQVEHNLDQEAALGLTRDRDLDPLPTTQSHAEVAPEAAEAV